MSERVITVSECNGSFIAKDSGVALVFGCAKTEQDAVKDLQDKVKCFEDWLIPVSRIENVTSGISQWINR